MLLGGLWHGASWNFLIWGAIHGSYLAFERYLGKESIYHKLPKFGQFLITFFIVLIAWVFFRADTLPDAGRYLSSMFGLATDTASGSVMAGLVYNPYYIVNFILAAVVIWIFPQTWDFTRKLSWSKLVWCIIVFFIALIALTTQSYNPFIYFIF